MPYLIEVPDTTGKLVTVEVSREVYEVFDEERKQRERERNEKRRHGTDIPLCDVLKTKSSECNLDEQLVISEKLADVIDIISKCTPTQRKRFYLNRIDGFSLVEIAKMEATNVSSVFRSVQAVVKQLKKVL